MNHRPEYDALFELPIAERRELMHALWGSIAADASSSDLPESAEVIAEVRKRLARLAANPEFRLSWAEAKKRMRED